MIEADISDSESSVQATLQQVLAGLASQAEVKQDLQLVRGKLEDLEKALGKLEADVSAMAASLKTIAAALSLLVKVARNPLAWALFALFFGGPELAAIFLGGRDAGVSSVTSP